MEDKTKKEFKAALAALGFRQNVLATFFQRINNMPNKTVNEQLIESIEGGVKGIFDFGGTVERTVQASKRDRLKVQTMTMHLIFIDCNLVNQLIQGDLDLAVSYEIKTDTKEEEKMYQSLFDMTSCSKHGYCYDTYDYFGQLIKHWRNSLEMNQYQAYVLGKPTYSPVFREADLFLNALEGVHVIMGKRKKKFLRKDMLPPDTPTFIRG